MLFVFICLAGLVLGLAPPAFSTHGASALKNIAVSENFYGVDIIDHQAWIVGYYGTILHSSDRGKSWEVQSSPTQSSLFNVRFVSPLKGWIGGSYGWQAADAGMIGICWTNTLANVPPWGATTPLVGVGAHVCLQPVHDRCHNQFA